MEQSDFLTGNCQTLLLPYLPLSKTSVNQTASWTMEGQNHIGCFQHSTDGFRKLCSESSWLLQILRVKPRAVKNNLYIIFVVVVVPSLGEFQMTLKTAEEGAGKSRKYWVRNRGNVETDRTESLAVGYKSTQSQKRKITALGHQKSSREPSRPQGQGSQKFHTKEIQHWFLSRTKEYEAC